MEVFAYDPEIENWDQSPCHNNERGSQGTTTLSVKGASRVPLIEGHSDTRERWTGNFTTWSNKNRIVEEGPPYTELCFKRSGEETQKRLREYIRSRGYGSWFTVITSEKGFYRSEDVLNFLDHHLPQWRPGRKWRIIMADDYSPHKTDNVWRLCWERGYMMIPHGGGVTPIAQTPDTDLNSHVKREYVSLETRELIHQFRNSAVAVPRVKEEQAIDLMHDLLSLPDLHLKATEGYKKTGATVALEVRISNFAVKQVTFGGTNTCAPLSIRRWRMYGLRLFY